MFFMRACNIYKMGMQSGSWQYSSECLALLVAYKEVIEHVLYACMQYVYKWGTRIRASRSLIGCII